MCPGELHGGRGSQRPGSSRRTRPGGCRKCSDLLQQLRNPHRRVAQTSDHHVMWGSQTHAGSARQGLRLASETGREKLQLKNANRRRNARLRSRRSRNPIMIKTMLPRTHCRNVSRRAVKDGRNRDGHRSPASSRLEARVTTAEPRSKVLKRHSPNRTNVPLEARVELGTQPRKLEQSAKHRTARTKAALSCDAG